jgi:hypothetical protein
VREEVVEVESWPRPAPGHGGAHHEIGDPLFAVVNPLAPEVDAESAVGDACTASSAAGFIEIGCERADPPNRTSTMDGL